jgi:hypothetical protein
MAPRTSYYLKPPTLALNANQAMILQIIAIATVRAVNLLTFRSCQLKSANLDISEVDRKYHLQLFSSLRYTYARLDILRRA